MRARGSKEILCQTVIEAVQLAMKLEDKDMRVALYGLIMFIEKERDEFKKVKKQKPQTWKRSLL